MSETDSVRDTPRLPFPPVVLGIAGCSGSGKGLRTWLPSLAHALGGIHFHLDNYYLDLGHMPYSERIKQNFDDPAMIESSLLAPRKTWRPWRGARRSRAAGLRLLHVHTRRGAHRTSDGRRVLGGGRAVCALLSPRIAAGSYNLRVYIDRLGWRFASSSGMKR